MTQQTISIKQRGCGWPKKGKIYGYIPVDKKKGGFYGNPVMNYVLCIPGTIPPDLALSYQGMECISRGVLNAQGQEIYDVYDWIGQSAYPNVSDFILEIAELGLHQLIEKTFPFQLLTPESEYKPIHANAGIVDPKVYFKECLEDVNFKNCPQRHPAHMDLDPAWIEKEGDFNTCSGLYLNDIVDGVPIGTGRDVLRKMPSFEYRGFTAPESRINTPSKDGHYPAVFMRIPIGRMMKFLVYEDKETNSHEQALKELERLDERLRNVQIVNL